MDQFGMKICKQRKECRFGDKGEIFEQDSNLILASFRMKRLFSKT